LKRLLIATLVGMLAAAGCASGPVSTPGARGLQVLATTTILADLARNVAGDQASVDSLLPAGADPHAYQPTPQDAVRISESDVLVINGADYERAFQSVLEDARGKPVITASEGLTPATTGGEVNPHFWVNPRFAVTYVENIRDGLSQADPAHAAVYSANAEAYILKLKTLDAWAEQQLSVVPPGRRLLVTNHDSLGYFADRYGFDVVGIVIPSASDESGTSAGQLAKIVDTVKAEGVPAIFLDAVENPALAQQIADETGAKVVNDLHFESLSGPDGPAPTYIEMIHYNVSRIVDALKP
jgi:zinc/manganese transport system substrate-binding protein